jgi:hypothetical protein
MKNQFSFFKATLCAMAVVLSPVFVEQVDAHEKGVHVQEGLTALDSEDFVTASQKFAEAFEEGDADGAFFLGRMLELGIGAEPNLQAAIGSYLAGSVKGSAAAKNRLGVLHVQGLGVLQDYTQGATLVCEAAELGDPNGAFNCASLTLEGRGVEKDEVEAYALFAKAAELGHLGAKNEYANALIDGRFVEKDEFKAVQMFQQTAAQGNPVGLFALGQAFAVGIGVDQDAVKAHSYFNLAAAMGHPQASAARTSIEASMTPEMVTAAQQRAKAWRPDPSGDPKEPLGN